MDRPVTRSLPPAHVSKLRAALAARGHVLARNAKNQYIAFEVRTEGRSIFTLYTSGKLVSTLRAGDTEGLAVEAEIAGVCGDAPSAPGEAAAGSRSRTRAPTVASGRGTRAGLTLLLGCDETGTGELLGSAVIGGAALPPARAEALAAIVEHVDTKVSRAASGWEDLDERLRGLPGLHLVTLPIRNRIFDAWSKNGLLDLAYVRVVGDLLAAHGLGPGRPAGGLSGVEIVIDDYGAGALLSAAIEAWRGDGAHVLLQHKADDEHLAARAASVAARAARAREFEGVKAEIDDGPLGTGNAGHAETLRWMRGRARAGRPWPSFVKASFRTARDMLRLPEVEKRRVPPPRELMDEDAARDLIAGRLDLADAAWRCGGASTVVREFRVTASGELIAPKECTAWELLPVLAGGIVLSAELEQEARADPGCLEPLLRREDGLLAGWRVLVGPAKGEADPALVALARAHRAGVLCVVATDEPKPGRRAAAAGALLLRGRKGADEFILAAGAS